VSILCALGLKLFDRDRKDSPGDPLAEDRVEVVQRVGELFSLEYVSATKPFRLAPKWNKRYFS
jgi:hypothetical protein